jgi:hypothetical protein
MEKRIKLTVYNSFTNEILMFRDEAFNRNSAVKNKYSKWWRKTRRQFANDKKLDIHWVRLKLSVYEKDDDSDYLSVGKTVLTLPRDMTNKDYDVVLAFLNYLKLA